MTYRINWSDPNLKVPSSITLEPLTTNATTTSLVLFGKGAPNYGEGQQQNFLRLLENFCSDVEPQYPTIGQFWYDRGTNQLKIRQLDGTGTMGQLLSSWKVIGTSVAADAPSPASVGDLWFNTGSVAPGSSALNYYTPTGWTAIADVDVLNAHAADDSLHLTPTQNSILDSIASIISAQELIALNNIAGNIQDQLNTLSNSGSSISNALQEESNTRLSADMGLQSQITAEISARESADTSNYNALLALANSKVSKAGDGMSGFLTLTNTNPTNTWHAVPKQYLDNTIFNAFSAMGGGGVLYQREFETVASASVNTNFTLPSGPIVFGTYTPGSNDLFVFVGGIKQRITTNYLEFTSSQVNFTVPINTGTIVTFEKFILGGGLNSPSTAAVSSIVRSSVTSVANQTAFTVPAGFTNVTGSNTLLVWVNGVKQIANVGSTVYSYAETSGTTITFNTPLPAGAIVELVGFNLVSPATIQRNVFVATNAGQTQFLLNPSINAASAGTWTFVSGVHQGKSEAVTTPNGYAIVLASGVRLGTLVEVYAFKIA